MIFLGLPNRLSLADEYFLLLNPTKPGQNLTVPSLEPDKPKCDCGAEKCKTTHAHWCSTK